MRYTMPLLALGAEVVQGVFSSTVVIAVASGSNDDAGLTAAILAGKWLVLKKIGTPPAVLPHTNAGGNLECTHVTSGNRFAYALS